MNIEDVVIVGGGPAGLMALLQAIREGLAARLITEERPGGLLRAARRIDNQLGYPPGSGRAWCALAAPQLAPLASRIIIATASAVVWQDGLYHVSAADLGIRSRCLILATGTEPAPFHLDLPPSPRLHRDPRRLPEELRGQRVAVIGGGEAAIDGALCALDRHAEVRLFARGAALAASPTLLAEARKRNLRHYTNAQPISLEASADAWHLSFSGPLSWTAQHLLVAVGRRPRLALLDTLAPCACTPHTVHGPLPGLFLAGDVLRPRDRFLAAALGDGQLAACLCRDFLKKETVHDSH